MICIDVPGGLASDTIFCVVSMHTTVILAHTAMFGCTSYPDCPLFRHSGAAMYTMFTCLTMEGWVDLVVETEEYYPGMSSVPPKLFFMTYIFIVVYILLPVFVAGFFLGGFPTAQRLFSSLFQLVGLRSTYQNQLGAKLECV